MNWNGCERKRSWPNLNYYLGTGIEELSKTTRLSQDSRSLERCLNPGDPGYDYGMINQWLVTFGLKRRRQKIENKIK